MIAIGISGEPSLGAGGVWWGRAWLSFLGGNRVVGVLLGLIGGLEMGCNDLLRRHALPTQSISGRRGSKKLGPGPPLPMQWCIPRHHEQPGKLVRALKAVPALDTAL